MLSGVGLRDSGRGALSQSFLVGGAQDRSGTLEKAAILNP